MKLVKYNKRKHGEELKVLLASRQLSGAFQDIPSLGWVFYGGDPTHLVGAAFLRKVEGAKAMILDSIITNPTYSDKLRHEALEALYDKVTAYADKYGIPLIGFTLVGSIVRRSESRGFTDPGHQLLVRLPRA